MYRSKNKRTGLRAQKNPQSGKLQKKEKKFGSDKKPHQITEIFPAGKRIKNHIRHSLSGKSRRSR